MNYKHLRLIFAVSITSIFLSACVSTGGSQTKTSANTPEPANSKVEQTEKPKVTVLGNTKKAEFDVSTSAAFENMQKVIIAGFKVGFVESKGDSAKAGGGLTGSGFGGKSTAFINMEGVAHTQMQQLTDTAYNHFMDQLKKAGYDVIDHNTLYSTEAFTKVKTYDFPYKVDNSGWFSDYGVSTYFIPSDYGENSPIWAGEIHNVTGGFGFANPASATADFAKEQGIKVINVKYLIDFAYFEGSGDGFWSSRSSMNVADAVYITPGARLNVVGGWGGTFSTDTGNMTLEESIMASGSAGELKEVTTDTEKTVELLSNVVGLLGGLGTNKTRKYTLAADETKYQQAATEVALSMNNNFIQKMIDLR